MSCPWVERYLGRVCQLSEAMQWVQGECRLGSRQWKSQEGSLAFKWLQFPCFGELYVLKRFSMSGNRWDGYALWFRTLLFLQVVREIDKNWVQYVLIAPMCSLPHAYMLFPHGKVFGPPCIFPRGDRRLGPIFSNYRSPLVIIITNQLVPNFVKVHQYFTQTSHCELRLYTNSQSELSFLTLTNLT